MNPRKQVLLEAAGRLFHRYGPHKTTIGDIARAAGVGVGTVYLEFPNKDTILRELSEASHRSILKAIERAWASDGLVDERLRRALKARTDGFLRLARDSVHGADLLHCSTCAPIAKAHRAFRIMEQRSFAKFLAQGAEDEVFVVEDPLASARTLLSAYETFSPPALFLRDQGELLRDLERLHELVFAGLLARPT